MESKKREKKEVLGFPVADNAVPNRAHTEMLKPEAPEQKKTQNKRKEKAEC